MDASTYYATQSPITDPGEYAPLLDALPLDLTELHAAVNGILIHIWKVREYYPHLLESRPYEVFIRHTRRVLEGVLRLDDRPINIARPEERRLIVDCRHFAVLLCSVFRHRGIPARARCGFGTYLEDGYYADHWVCECWDPKEGRWVMEDADAQMHDLSPDQFITGARAWQMCREDAANGNLFGFEPNMRGMWVARANLIRDFAALNGFESVSGDAWAMKDDEDLTDDDIGLLDQAAKLAMTDEDFDGRRSLYERSEILRVPRIIHNYDYVVTNEWRMVEWEKER